MRVWSLGQEDPLEKEMATHSSILAWEIPWTEEPGRLQVMGSQKSWTWLSNETTTPKGPLMCVRNLSWAKLKSYRHFNAGVCSSCHPQGLLVLPGECRSPIVTRGPPKCPITTLAHPSPPVWNFFSRRLKVFSFFLMRDLVCKYAWESYPLWLDFILRWRKLLLVVFLKVRTGS